MFANAKELNKAIKKANKAIYEMGNYHNGIPTEQIFSILDSNGLTAVQEDGTRWEGFLCGENSSCLIALAETDKHALSLAWYMMRQGRYEITAYIN